MPSLITDEFQRQQQPATPELEPFTQFVPILGGGEQILEAQFPGGVRVLVLDRGWALYAVFCPTGRMKRGESAFFYELEHEGADTHVTADGTYTGPPATADQLSTFFDVMLPRLALVRRMHTENEQRLRARVAMEPDVATDAVWMQDFRAQFSTRIEHWASHVRGNHTGYTPEQLATLERGDAEFHYDFQLKWGTDAEKEEVRVACERYHAQRIEALYPARRSAYSGRPLLQSVVECIQWLRDQGTEVPLRDQTPPLNRGFERPSQPIEAH